MAVGSGPRPQDVADPPTVAAIADEDGVHTSESTPVYHAPKDECGGGSAYAAGIIDRWEPRLSAAVSAMPFLPAFLPPLCSF